MRIVLAGGSGLVGRALLPRLRDHAVVAIGRRALGDDAGVLADQLVAPVEAWPDLLAGQQLDAAISTLGTTIRQAGSPAAFAAVDRDLVIAFARAAHRAGARHFLMVSSVGAQGSAGNLYLRTKGEAEAGVSALGFPRVDIFRPGLLRGERTGPARPVERALMAVSPLTDLLTPAVLDQYRSIAASDVAGAIALALGRAGEGIFLHHNRDMLRETAGIV